MLDFLCLLNLKVVFFFRFRNRLQKRARKMKTKHSAKIVKIVIQIDPNIHSQINSLLESESVIIAS